MMMKHFEKWACQAGRVAAEQETSSCWAGITPLLSPRERPRPKRDRPRRERFSMPRPSSSARILRVRDHLLRTLERLELDIVGSAPHQLGSQCFRRCRDMAEREFPGARSRPAPCRKERVAAPCPNRVKGPRLFQTQKR